MAHYLVKAKPEDLKGLRAKLDNGDVAAEEPFGEEMHRALLDARIDAEGKAIWRETCYCSPPLKQERSVLELHFSDIHTTTMTPQDAQTQLADLPSLWA